MCIPIYNSVAEVNISPCSYLIPHLWCNILLMEVTEAFRLLELDF